MRKALRFFFLPALVLCASAARAEWSLVSQDGFSRIYLDPASRKPAPDGSILVRALTDYDPEAPEAASFKLSEKGLSEIEDARFDCAGKTYRTEGGAWYEGHMAVGAVRSTYPAKTGWSGVPPYYAGLFSKICATGITR